MGKQARLKRERRKLKEQNIVIVHAGLASASSDTGQKDGDK